MTDVAPHGTEEPPASTVPCRCSTTYLGQLAFDWPTTPAADVVRASPTSTSTVPSESPTAKPSPAPPALRRSLREVVERYLRENSLPYINVDEAKKALFAGAKLRSFHFVVYFKDRSNWLLYAAQLRKEGREDLKQWEAILGDGFMAVVAKQETAGALKFRTLAGDAVEIR